MGKRIYDRPCPAFRRQNLAGAIRPGNDGHYGTPPTSTPENRSVRLLEAGERVRHAISDLLTRQMVHDDVLTAHSVACRGAHEPDLRHATVFVKPLWAGRGYRA
jgi:hypothetical protein